MLYQFFLTNINVGCALLISEITKTNFQLEIIFVLMTIHGLNLERVWLFLTVLWIVMTFFVLSKGKLAEINICASLRGIDFYSFGYI
jgi:hypothetical protein